MSYDEVNNTVYNGVNQVNNLVLPEISFGPLLPDPSTLQMVNTEPMPTNTITQAPVRRLTRRKVPVSAVIPNKIAATPEPETTPSVIESTGITSNESEMDGGLRVKKIVKEYNIQDDINKDLYERISIDAFIEKSIDTKVKNTVGIKCKKCGSDNIFSESRQTRSADEAMTIFYTCLNCGNKWKVN